MRELLWAMMAWKAYWSPTAKVPISSFRQCGMLARMVMSARLIFLTSSDISYRVPGLVGQFQGAMLVGQFGSTEPAAGFSAGRATPARPRTAAAAKAASPFPVRIARLLVGAAAGGRRPLGAPPIPTPP